MINFATITSALETQIQSYLNTLVSDGNSYSTRYYVKRSEKLNHREDKTPWVGIYRGRMKYQPRSLGKSLCNWRALPQIRVVVQGAATRSGELAEERCEIYTKEVLDAILSDYTIGGTVETLLDFDIEPTFKQDENDSLHFHMNIITMTLQTKAGFVPAIPSLADPWNDAAIWDDNDIWQEA